MKRITVILIALFAVLYAMADVYSDMLNAGIKAYNSGNYQKALTFFNKANEQAPKGRAALWVSKCKKAIKDRNQHNNVTSQPYKPPTPSRVNQEPLSNRTFTANGVSFTMVGVQGGTFQMGSNDGADWEKPVPSATLSSYYIGQTEVTQALWKAVMGSNPSYFKGYNLPVEQVSWNDCQTFIRNLNQLTGENFRLPTEAEWEYAAKGGRRSRGFTYSGNTNLDYVAWYWDNSGRKTHPVATKSPNELGIYDMSGNVWELCQDWYGDYSSSAQTNSTGPASGSGRVARGGCWYNNAARCRTANRNSVAPADTYNFLGLRLAR